MRLLFQFNKHDNSPKNGSNKKPYNCHKRSIVTIYVYYCHIFVWDFLVRSQVNSQIQKNLLFLFPTSIWYPLCSVVKHLLAKEKIWMSDLGLYDRSIKILLVREDDQPHWDWDTAQTPTYHKEAIISHLSWASLFLERIWRFFFVLYS
jgi:hypothetical protein